MLDIYDSNERSRQKLKSQQKSSFKRRPKKIDENTRCCYVERFHL